MYNVQITCTSYTYEPYASGDLALIDTKQDLRGSPLRREVRQSIELARTEFGLTLLVAD